MLEQWRAIEGWPYSVSSLGQLRNDRTGKILRGRLIAGYLVALLIDGDRRMNKGVHRLVCETFHGPCPPGKRVAAHRDGSRTNNVPENVYWASDRENQLDRHKHGTGMAGGANPRAILTAEGVANIRAAPSTSGVISKLSERYGVTRSTIASLRCRNPRNWKGV